ncbi:MAG TPA: glycoside hydrolase family 3 C-terminal domain-containing protein [Polyangiaceae bacterium]|nr:glycoside hydrolase family 3 C-terminal domain-containing protein [Polyangiaceae bacterium]
MRSYLRLVPIVVSGGFLIMAQPSCGHEAVPGVQADNGSSNTTNNTTSNTTNNTTNNPGTGGSGTGDVPVITGPIAGSSTVEDISGPVTKAECPSNPTYRDTYSVGYQEQRDPRVEQTLKAMTTDMKIKQLQGVPLSNGQTQYTDIQRSQDVELDASTTIRGYMYRDGPHGVNLDALQADRKSSTSYSTVFPTTVTRSATFDPEIEYKVGEAMGDETAASRNTMLLIPCMNILRNPLWGRAQETYGEDTFHTGRMASAMTLGTQQWVAGCAKHFAANNIENGRMTQDAEMDEQTLRETYGRHFRMVIQDGGTACIMASYNLINGVKSTQNKHLLTDILRNDFKFRGLVISDWWAMPPAGQTFVSDAATAQANAADAVNAGLSIEVPWINNFAQLGAVVGTRVSNEQLDKAAGYILEQKFRFGAAYGKLGDSTPLSKKVPTSQLVDAQIYNEDHLKIAKQAAVEGMVLLKNESSTLPIQAGKKVAVVGLRIPYTLQSTNPRQGTFDFAKDIGLGDRGSSRVNADPAQTVGAFAGITASGAKHTATVTASNSVDDAVNGADFVVVMVGNTPDVEGEEYAIPSGGDRTSLDLKSGQNELITQVAALGKPMVVVIQAGGIVSMPWLSSVPAVVMAWYPGERGGAALGDLLFGDESFSGRLPVTWSNSLDELDLFHDPSNRTHMDYFIGYRHYDNKGLKPLFPFGYGLTYTKFDYVAMQTGCSSVKKDGVVDVKVDIKNSGDKAGTEVVQVYVSFPTTTARRSKKELKGFARITLAAGETKRLTIPVRVKDLDYYDMTKNAWVIDSGSYKFMVGPNANDESLTLMDTVNVVD